MFNIHFIIKEHFFFIMEKSLFHFEAKSSLDLQAITQ